MVVATRQNELLAPSEYSRSLWCFDAYLDDERFITPWRALFAARLGRPSIPVQTLLRLLYLKHRYQLGYRTLCREVADSISWRRFCHIPLDQPVPHPTTLVKLVGRAGPKTIEQLNHALLAKLAGERVLRCRKLRIDTTVVEADIDHPTDADLLEHAVRTLGGLVRRVHARGAATHTRSATAPAPPGAGSSRSPGPCGGAPGRRPPRSTGSPPRSHRSPGAPWPSSASGASGYSAPARPAGPAASWSRPGRSNACATGGSGSKPGSATSSAPSGCDAPGYAALPARRPG